MAGEYWKQIQDLQHQVEQEQRKKIDESRRKEVTELRERARQERETRKVKDKQLRETLQFLKKLTFVVKTIFTDVKNNDPTIQAVESRIVVSSINERSFKQSISLEWGKFELEESEKEWIEYYHELEDFVVLTSTAKLALKLRSTSREREKHSLSQLIDKYGIKHSFSVDTTRFPEQVFEHNFYSVKASYDLEKIRLGNEFPSRDVLENPSIVLPSLAEALRNPERHEYVLKKGINYLIWRKYYPPPPAHSSPSAASRYPDCCCS